MTESFILEMTRHLYSNYGDRISEFKIMFPSKRCRLFFAQALSGVAKKPIWEPEQVYIESIMEQISGIKNGDRIRLISELYKVYSEIMGGDKTEAFDRFFRWGEIMIADFDAVDKYLIDAKTLFINISDLKEIESDLSYLLPDQIEVIKTFWSSFHSTSFSKEKTHFFSIWKNLFQIYTKFKERLFALSIGYSGMIYRHAAEKIKNGADIDSSKYIIAGFNALSPCEKILFDRLKNQGNTLFFWDYDSYYVDNKNQEAGLFLRENTLRFPEEQNTITHNIFFKTKEITAISSPSDSLQCKYASVFLEQIRKQKGNVGRETAIVLTDETLLPALLHSIEPSNDKINITMGYPLAKTLCYTIIDRLITLQERKKKNLFHYRDVIAILSHPYTQAIEHSCEQLRKTVENKQVYYVDNELFSASEILSNIFSEPKDLIEYIVRILSIFQQCNAIYKDDKQQAEFITQSIENLIKLKNSIEECAISISDKLTGSLIRKVLKSTQIPYQGEPLVGIQVMGILETRAIDFENVLILSANDDTFPGNLSLSSSFIPFNLRLAYQMPTAYDHEGVYAYYFYRLLQRAKNVHIAYSSKSDEKRSGEKSRYIYQLEYESGHKIKNLNLDINVNLPAQEDETVYKNDSIAEKLNKFCNGSSYLSPSALYKYVECPLKFYYNSVLQIKEKEEIEEGVDNKKFGTLLHSAMEILYKDLIGIKNPQEKIKSLIKSEQIDKAIEAAVLKENISSIDKESGNLILIKDILKKYVNNFILPYDGALTENYTISGTEMKNIGEFTFNDKKVHIGGISDRIDKTDSGIRIIDYKTGINKLEFAGIEGIFSGKNKELNSAVFQIFTYCMLLENKTKCGIEPALYFVKNMNDPEFKPNPIEKVSDQNTKNKYTYSEVLSFKEYSEEFRAKLSGMLSKIFDKQTPFSKTEDKGNCSICPYLGKICNGK